MENYIVINGNKAELTEEQLKRLGIEIKKTNPFIRDKGENYCFINEHDIVKTDIDLETALDNKRLKIANYCTDVKLMKQRALHETLNRLLWRFACENGELENEWDGHKNSHWMIYYNELSKEFKLLEHLYLHYLCCPHFPSKKIAERAIEEIIKPFMKEHPDFVW